MVLSHAAGGGCSVPPTCRRGKRSWKQDCLQLNPAGCCGLLQKTAIPLLNQVSALLRVYAGWGSAYPLPPPQPCLHTNLLSHFVERTSWIMVLQMKGFSHCIRRITGKCKVLCQLFGSFFIPSLLCTNKPSLCGSSFFLLRPRYLSTQLFNNAMQIRQS